MKLDDDTKSALIWITNILHKHQIPFQIAGGFAAKVYGSTRPLQDIDIDIPEDKFNLIINDVKDFITFGPDQFKSDKWDLYLMTLNYNGQEIDLSGANKSKVFNSKNNMWMDLREDFSSTVFKKINGLKLPIISRKNLISYKKILAREEDLIDVQAIQKNEGKKYDLIVNKFDTDRCKTLREKKYLDVFLKNLPKNAHILDVGCGMAEPIAQYCIENGFKITGIDASKAMLALAKKRFPQMEWIYGDMREVIIHHKTYDAIIAYDSFFHLIIDDQIEMLEKFSQWLKPGGKLLITTGTKESEVIKAPMHGHRFSYYSMSLENYVKYFALNFFEVLLSEEDQPFHKIWVAQKNNKDA